MSIQPGQAIERISLSIEHIFKSLNPLSDAQQSHASGVFLQALNLDKLKIDLDLSTDSAGFSVSLEQFNLPEPYQQIRQLKFNCQTLDIQADYVYCQGKTLSVDSLFSNRVATSTDFNFRYFFSEQRLVISINKLNAGQGNISATLTMDEYNWSVDFNAIDISYKQFEPYLKYYYKEFLATIEEAGFLLSIKGQLKGQLAQEQAAQTKKDKISGLKSLQISGHIKNLHYTHADDLADKISFNFNYQLKNTGTGIHAMALDLKNISGELFQNEIYLAFTAKEQINIKLKYNPDTNNLTVSRFKLLYPELFNISSSAKFALNQKQSLKDFHIAYKLDDLEQFNKLYLKNILEGTDYEGLQIEGGVKGFFARNRKKIQLNNVFNAFNLDFNGQIAVIGLDGELNWNNHKTPEKNSVSQLSWQGLHLNELPFGQTHLKFVTFNNRLKLLNETDIPLFDGALHINTLELTRIGEQADKQDKNKGMTITIDGMIRPVSLKLLSEHFNWPLLDGKLSAVIPQTTYNSHSLNVGGAMMMQVFDGSIVFKNLRIEHPLEESAVLFANIDLQNLDLQSLTKTFNFGEIEGRMEGKIKDLQLNSWQPVAFDAYFRTPENDHSRHRISQRAIDNLSSLGGASGILSRSFLSFFKTFHYDKIGLSCKLKNNICHMAGIEKKGSNAYYLVKGSGIPRIDVMGFQNEVNWQVLISRLRNIQSANEAIIE